MVVAINRRAPDDSIRGLEQFRLRGGSAGIEYCIAGPTPYALEFSNPSDVICLLLGDIAGRARFEDDGERPLVFEARTSAFHPRGGNVRVRASTVRQGFIAFGYSAEFQALADEPGLDRARRAGSRNNIRKRSIHSLATYALARLRSRLPLEPFEIQSLGSLVYLETLRDLDARVGGRLVSLSDRQFAAICSYIDADLGKDITCAELAAAAEVPLRVVFEGMRHRTGMTPYRFVTQRRIDRARAMLTQTVLPISEIALACGFSSQQHLTSAMSARLGTTPQRLRRASGKAG